MRPSVIKQLRQRRRGRKRHLPVLPMSSLVAEEFITAVGDTALKAAEAAGTFGCLADVIGEINKDLMARVEGRRK